MAGETTIQTDGAATLKNLFMPNGKTVAVAETEYEITTGELEAGDIIGSLRLPKNAHIIDGFLATDDLDTNVCPTLTLKVGTTANDDSLLAVNTVGQAGGVARFDGADLVNASELTADTRFDVKVGTAAATAAAGTVRLVILYTNGNNT